MSTLLQFYRDLKTGTDRSSMSDEMPTIPRPTKGRQAGCLCGLCDSSEQSCVPYCRMDRSNTYEHPTLINNNKDDLRKSLDQESEHDETIIVEHLKDFSQETTAHGIARIGASKSCCGRLSWSLGVIICFVLFTTQAFWVIEKFQRNEKIVNVEMKFDPSQFPAITVCNLNPFKKSLARQVTGIRETMEAFDRARAEAKEFLLSQKRKKREENEHATGVDKRQIPDRQLEPIYAHCKCIGNASMECLRFESAPSSDGDTCLCTYDKAQRTAWPCFRQSVWQEERCPVCHYVGYCDSPSSTGDAPSVDWACLCRPPHQTESNQSAQSYCLGKPAEIKKLWIENQKWSSSTVRPTEPPEFVKAMGFTGMTDAVAMRSRAKENLLFSVASLSEQERISLSYEKREFIELCSFNGRECHIDEDFKLHVDPVFGNCYIFNADKSKNLTSTRAGPMYGLILMVRVNTSDYMSSSEAAGVRLSIHGQSEYPFPDTFGYSAPTGFVSSFGIKRRKVERLPKPYGDCITDGKDEKYIYRNYIYQSEGCHRSCFQHALIKSCSCGDPRLPLPANSRHCSAYNATARECLEAKMAELGDFHHTKRLNCDCKQPCSHDVYGVTFSCAKWPSSAADAGDCDDMHADECVEHYKQQAALIEIYYEQLNYESLTETEAYGLVNLIADFGGQLGLWMGISVITCMEFMVLLFDLATLCCQRRKERIRRKSLRKTTAHLEPVDFTKSDMY